MKSLPTALSPRVKRWLFILTICLIPLKLSLTYILLIPLLLLWLCSEGSFDALKKCLELSFVRPLFVFVTIGIFTGFFGLRPVSSLTNLAGLLFFLTAIPFFSSGVKHVGIYPCILALLVGQSLSSYHSLLQSAFPEQISRLFIGAVSESGQLALTIPLIASLAITCFFLEHRLKNIDDRVSPSLIDTLLFVVNSIVLCLFGLSNYFHTAIAIKITLAVIIAIAVLFCLYQLVVLIYNKDKNNQKIYGLVVRFLLPLLLAALLVNLKRGPWIGVTIGGTLLLILYYRRLVLPAVIAIALAVLCISPIRDRLEQSSRDFFISGGRSTIWNIGAELSLKYPLGIGYDNSSFLRDFAPEIPPELIHFHNNLLNILVETGWIGLIIFLWWLFEIIRASFSRKPLGYSPLARGIGCSFIAWQTAGTVEYNFGDSEVFLIVLLLMGLLVYLSDTDLADLPKNP